MSGRRVKTLLLLGVVAGASTGCAAATEIAERMDVELVPEYRQPVATTTTTEAATTTTTSEQETTTTWPDIIFEDGSGTWQGKEFCLPGGGCQPGGGVASPEQNEIWIRFVSDPTQDFTEVAREVAG